MVDIDLDVVRMADGTVEVVDEDEFHAHQAEMEYPPRLVDTVRATAARIAIAVENRHEPFGEVGSLVDEHAPPHWRGAIMADKLVSVIIPVRNEAPFIEATIDSVLAQDYQGHIEVVVADGMSTDGTRDILDRLGEPRQQDPLRRQPDRPHTIRFESGHSGVPGRRHRAMRRSRRAASRLHQHCR